jgi:hypothetical protein
MTIEPGRIGGLTDLRQINPDHADATQLILLLLDGLAVDEAEQVLAEVAEPAGHGWFETSTGAYFQIVRANAADIVLDTNRIDDAVAALDAVDALLNGIEQQLGLVLEPIAMGHAPTTDQPAFHIKTEQHHITLSVPLATIDLRLLQNRAKVIAPAAQHMPCIYEVGLIAAHLDIDEAADLATGDMLIMAMPAKAQLMWPSGICGGTVDLTNATFTPFGPDGEFMSTDRTGGFSVPITITLPPQTTSLAALAALKPGTTLALAPITNGLQVVLTVAGRSFATGELVQVGDQFAVMIEQRTDMDDLTEAVASPVEEED